MTSLFAVCNLKLVYEIFSSKFFEKIFCLKKKQKKKQKDKTFHWHIIMYKKVHSLNV